MHAILCGDQLAHLLSGDQLAHLLSDGVPSDLSTAPRLRAHLAKCRGWQNSYWESWQKVKLNLIFQIRPHNGVKSGVSSFRNCFKSLVLWLQRAELLELRQLPPSQAKSLCRWHLQKIQKFSPFISPCLGKDQILLC